VSRLPAAERAERIMSIVPWLVTPGGVSITETCEQFKIDRQDLLEDLKLLFYNVGVHPFTPDALVTVFIEEEDDVVEVELGDFFRRPLRLGADEALAILAAARMLLASPDPDPTLQAAAERVEAALGSTERLVGVEFNSIDPTVFDDVRTSLESGTVLRIRYHSFGRDELTEREVEPLQLRSRDGRWYLQAWCTTAGEHRLFRLDRMLETEVLGVPVQADRPAPSSDPFDFSGADRRIRLVLAPEDQWVATQYPIEEERTLEDGRTEVVLASGSDAWLERLLLRMAPGTEATDAISGAPLDAERSEAARRILRRYA